MINILNKPFTIYLKMEYIFGKKKCIFPNTGGGWYLGHCIHIDATGIHPTEKEVKVVNAAPMPTDASQL